MLRNLSIQRPPLFSFIDLLFNCLNLFKLIPLIVKILIIEDEVRIATLIQQGLEEQENLVVIAYDGLTGKKTGRAK